MSTTTLKVMGINDDVTTCECCGRSDLKSTVVLSDGEGEVHFGSQCAAKALGYSLKRVNAEVAKVKKAEKDQKVREENARWFAEYQAYYSWKITTYGDATDNLERYHRYQAEKGGRA